MLLATPLRSCTTRAMLDGVAPRTRGVSRARFLLALGWTLVAGGNCAHGRDADDAESRAEARRMLAADYDAHLAELTAFARMAGLPGA